MSTNTWERPPVNSAEAPQRSEGHAEVAARTGRPLSGTVVIDGAGPTAGLAPVQTYERLTVKRFDELLAAYLAAFSAAVVSGKPEDISKTGDAYVTLRNAVFP